MKNLFPYKKAGLKFLLSIMLLLHAAPAFMQSTLHVVTRRVEKEFDFSSQDRLTVMAERGLIRIRKSSDAKIRVVLKLIAKNQDPGLARTELNYLHYTLAKKNREVIIKNYILLPATLKTDDVSSILRAEYEIFVPDHPDLSVSDNFGMIVIEKLDVKFAADIEYCDVTLDQVAGDVKLNVNVGDIQCINSTLNGTFKTSYSSIALNHVSGSLNLDTRFGDIKADLSGDMSLLDIHATSTDIFLINRDCRLYNLSLRSESGNVSISRSCYGLKPVASSTSAKFNRDPFEIDFRPAHSKGSLQIVSQSGSITLN
jgi:hypothetical protein